MSALFTEIFIPKAVYDELGDQAATDAVRNWIDQKPNWLSVQEINNKQYDAELALLDPGEREVIVLAEEISASLVILDEFKARQIAGHRGLRVTGTLSVLNVAGQRNLLNVPETVERLRQTSFRISSELYDWLLDQHTGQSQSRLGILLDFQNGHAAIA